MGIRSVLREFQLLRIAVANIDQTQQRDGRHGKAGGFGNGSKVKITCTIMRATRCPIVIRS